MSAIIVCILCLVNLFLWFLFFKKFNRLFSTDDIINSTKSELNKMILDVNRNAARNITLIEARVNELKAVIAEADARLSMVKDQYQKKALASAYQNKIESVAHKDGQISNHVAQAYKKNSGAVLPDASFEISKPLMDNKRNIEQKNLFEIEKAESEKKQVTITESGDVYQDVPLLKTDVYLSENPIVLPKSFNEDVCDRYAKGQTVEQIASALSRSVTEVQFVLDMNV